MLLLIVIVGTALAVSFLCSILEATLLSARVVRLTERAERGDRAAARLLDLKQNRIDDAIGAILTYNTIAHTIGAALAGAQAAHVFGDHAVGVFSAVLTVLILVVTEIIPKTIGTVHADRLSGFVGRVVSWMVWPPMKWVLVVTRALTRLIARDDASSAMTRGDVSAAVRLAERSGALETAESKILANLLHFERIRVEDVMTPRSVATMFDVTTPVADALADRDARAYSRVPIYEKTRDNVKGYVLMRELMRAVLDGGRGETPVSAHMRRVLVVPEPMNLAQALKEFSAHSEHLAIVVDEFGGMSGLVTMEDVIESALGVEIVDEFDKVADLRQVAKLLREKRMAQVRAQDAKAPGSDPEPGA